MAQPARAFQRERSQDRPVAFDDDDEEELEHEEEPPREAKRTRSSLRGYSLPVAGVVLISMLGATIWLLLNGRHESPSTPEIPRFSRSRDDIPKAPGNARGGGSPLQTTRSTSAGDVALPENDLHETVTDTSGASLQDTESATNHPAQMDPVAKQGGGANDPRVVQQRFDRLDSSLQALQSAMQLVLTEVRSSRGSGQAQEALESADRMVSLLKRQLASRDQENVRLRGELAARERLVNEMKLQVQRSSARSALAGWEIVGLTARNAALKDPGGQTHVLSIGETIVNGVQLQQIDPAGTRITTSAGALVYHGAR